MSAIDSLSNLNYNNFLVGGPSQVRKSNPLNGTTPAANTALGATPKTTASSSAVDEFQKYMQMTPAQKIRYGVLNELGITEEQLAALPPEQREAMEKKIADMIALKTGGTDQNALAIQQGQQTLAGGNNSDMFKAVQAAGRASLPLVNAFA